MCMHGAQLNGKNLIFGDIYLKSGAILSDIVNNDEDGAAKIIIGERTRVGKGTYLTGTLTMGNDCRIAAECQVGSGTYGNNVRIGKGADVYATIEDNAIIGNDCHVAGTVGKGAIMESKSILLTDSKLLAGKKIGANSCVASGMVISKDVPPNVAWFMDGTKMKIDKGWKAGIHMRGNDCTLEKA